MAACSYGTFNNRARVAHPLNRAHSYGMLLYFVWLIILSG